VTWLSSNPGNSGSIDHAATFSLARKLGQFRIAVKQPGCATA
jgi:hypothetical protein